MTDNPEDFAGVLTRARSGDTEDLQRAVSRFRPQLTRAIRRRRQMQSANLRVLYDTNDCLQSVLGGLFRRVADQSQPLEITSFKNLKRLLLKMSRQKLIDYERRCKAAKRPPHSGTIDEPVDEDGLTPSTIASHKEQLESLSDGLSETEKRILELTGDGHTSEEIAGIVEDRSARSIRRLLKRWVERFLE